MDNEHNSIHIAGWNRVSVASTDNTLIISVWHQHRKLTKFDGDWVRITIENLPLEIYNADYLYKIFIWPQIRVAVERCREEIQRDIDEMDTNSG